MTSDPSFLPAKAARALLACAKTGSLATLDEDGTPYVSLVAVSATPAGAPLLLISKLARHTANVARNPRVSLLLAAPEAKDPLAAPRLTVIGEIRPEPDSRARDWFLARVPEAGRYAGFPDFSYWRIDTVSAHLVAGFGRIVTMPAADLFEAAAG
jgi:putative heme iron utilization protein